jgi:hypothetical protein
LSVRHAGPAILRAWLATRAHASQSPQGAKMPVPRLRWLFYAYYPAHLLAIWLWRALM